MTRTRSRIARILASAACAALVFAWAPRPALADDTLNVLGASNGAGFYEVLDHVADEAGFFKQEHLIVDKQYISPYTAAQLVASGKADICSLAFEPIVQGYEKGLKLKYFLESDPRFVNVLGVLSDSPIHTLADFKGADIGEASPASPAETTSNAMLAGAGLRRSDYQYVTIGYGAQALSAMQSRKVAGAVLPAGEFDQEAVGGNVTFRIFRDPLLNDIGTYGFAATAATIQTKGDQLRRYSRAIVKAAILTRENPELAAKYFLEGAQVQVTPEAIAREARVLRLSVGDLMGVDPTSKRIGEMQLRGMDVYDKFLAANGVTKTDVPADDVVTNEFIDYANDFDHKAFIAFVKKQH
jgi:ABC-type nitrate/sulfonate/bicarbonate transport system substrate-binding protein